MAPGRLSFHSEAGQAVEAMGTKAKLVDVVEPPPRIGRHETITVKDILERRAKAGKLVALTAAYSDSDMFKAPVSLPRICFHLLHTNKPTAKTSPNRGTPECL